MDEQEALEALILLQGSDDYENTHVLADAILCDLLKALGHGDVVEAYENITPKWYA